MDIRIGVFGGDMNPGHYGPAPRRPLRWLPLTVLVAAVIFFVAVGLAFATYHYNGTYYAGGWPWFWFPFGWFFFLPLFFLAFFGFRWFFWGGWGWWGRGWYYGGYGDPALAALRERYARGEITRERYEQMLEDLEGRRGGSSA